MAELFPYPFAALIRRMFQEHEEQHAIFDLPESKFFVGRPDLDLSVNFHGAKAGTPLGPAAGPQSQMAQNLVLSWLAGCRILELKTVQIMDELDLPRPCIDMATVGYNVEWSQELKLEQSLDEYVKGHMLIEILKASGRIPVCENTHGTIFDMSVGYDLEGIKTDRVQAFINGMKDCSKVIEKFRAQIPDEYKQYRDIEFQSCLSDTLTLSTFHGCPPDEIERIIDYLYRHNGLNCVVKLNPMLLGEKDARALLNDVMGYDDVHIPSTAFERDTKWEQMVEFMGRLGDTATELGLGFGAKFTNTLIVENHRDFFPKEEKEMYLSGPPLHVLAFELVRRFRRTFGDRYDISFSAGIDRGNFASSVATGMVPVTVCTDLLKAGGYGRTQGYFKDLYKKMEQVGASTIDEFVIKSMGNGPAALKQILADTTYAGETRGEGQPELDDLPAEQAQAWLSAARLANTESYADAIVDDRRYKKIKNNKAPRKIDSHLEFFDCISCDKCIPVCPNDANFTLALPPRTIPLQFAVFDGQKWAISERGTMELEQEYQIANFADFCNECGNCDVFCPEHGGPYKVKPRFFGSRASFDFHKDYEGFFFERSPTLDLMLVRQGGVQFEIRQRRDSETTWFKGAGFALRFQADPALGIEGTGDDEVDLTWYHITRAIHSAIYASKQTNYVSMLGG